MNMAQNKTGARALLDLFFFLLCFHVVVAATSAGDDDRAPTGFSLKLIRRDFSANLTHDELFKRLLEQSEARLQWLKSSAASSSFKDVNVTALRPPVEQNAWSYMVSLRMGTGASQQDYWLELDTGSALTWTQCVPSDRYFPQEGRHFDPRGSPTYRQVPCNDPLCKHPVYRCVNNVCEYNLEYGDGSTSSGKLSRETFGFHTEGGRGIYQSITGLAFGCSHHTRIKFANGKIAGMLGMNGSPESLAVQLDGMGIAGGRFSYCIATFGFEGHAGYLRFGSDIVMRGAVKRTPMTRGGNYYLNLIDISVGNKRMGFDGRVFQRQPSTGKGGVIIDTASAMGYMVTPAFTRVRLAVVDHMKVYKLKPVMPELGTCFSHERGVAILPSMTFHFQGADLEVSGIQNFYTVEGMGLICWTTKVDDSMTIIGAAQQVNKRFTYDLRQSTLLFSDENCAHSYN